MDMDFLEKVAHAMKEYDREYGYPLRYEEEYVKYAKVAFGLYDYDAINHVNAPAHEWTPSGDYDRCTRCRAGWARHVSGRSVVPLICTPADNMAAEKVRC